MTRIVASSVLVTLSVVGLLRAGAGPDEAAITLKRHDELVRSLALSPDGKWLVTAGRDGKLYVWEFATGRVRAAMDQGVMGFQVVAFSPDGRTLATGGIDRNVTLWDFDRLLKAHAVK